MEPQRGQLEANGRARINATLERLGNPQSSPVLAQVRADHVTCAGMVAGVAAGVAAAAGKNRAAAALWGASSVLDVVDGVVARNHGTTTRGAFGDRVADRVSDAALGVGVTVRELAAGRRVNAALCVAAVATGAIPSYINAAAQNAGADAGRAAPGRAERCIAWAVAAGVPALCAPAAAFIAAGSIRASWYRWRQADRHLSGEDDKDVLDRW